MANDKILSMIGLATKAGKIVSGEFSTEQSVKSAPALMVITSSDASDHTKNKFTNMCSFYIEPLYFYGTRESLGRAAGKEFRVSLALQDEGFSKAIQKLIDP